MTGPESDDFSYDQTQHIVTNGKISILNNIDGLENEKIVDDDDLDELETRLPDGSDESDDTSGIFSLDVSDNEQKYKFWKISFNV